jgi:NADH:flavin oxidoreductase / NADH oxidase family
LSKGKLTRQCAAKAALMKRAAPSQTGLSHSRSFDQRRRPETFLTAIAMAFFWPSRMTSRLPLVRHTVEAFGARVEGEARPVLRTHTRGRTVSCHALSPYAVCRGSCAPYHRHDRQRLGTRTRGHRRRSTLTNHPGGGSVAFALRASCPQNDIADSDPQAHYVAEQLSGKGLAYLHIIEGDTSGLPVPPFDYKNLKRLFGGLVIANNGFDKPRANKALADGRADLIAFGKPFIANPDLVIRLFLDAPLTPVNRETLYGGSEQGYTDYPILRAVAPHACYHDTERAWG